MGETARANEPRYEVGQGTLDDYYRALQEVERLRAELVTARSEATEAALASVRARVEGLPLLTVEPPVQPAGWAVEEFRAAVLAILDQAAPREPGQ